MKDIIQKTLAVSRELDTLQREHQALLTQVKTTDELASRKFSVKILYPVQKTSDQEELPASLLVSSTHPPSLRPSPLCPPP